MDWMMGDSFGVESLVLLIFIIVIVSFIVYMVKGIKTWNTNNQSPRLTVESVVVSKRTDVSRRQNPNAGDITGAHGYSTSTSTRYYVTFEVESKDRMELSVSGPEYGMVVEGDRGKLSFQGTRYLGFERI